MKVNLKRGLKTSLGAAIVCTAMFAAVWYFTLPPDLADSDHSISRWWRGEHVSAHLSLALVVFVSAGLVGVVMGAFRQDTIHTKHETSA